MLDSPNQPVHNGTYFDCLENVIERAEVTLTFVCHAVVRMQSRLTCSINQAGILLITMKNFKLL